MEMSSQQTNQISAALIRAQKKIKPAIKDCTNSFTRSKYASLNSVFDACRDALLSEDLAITQYTMPSENGFVSLVTRLTHAPSDQWVISVLNLPITGKNEIQGIGIAITYARRYSLAALCGIVNEDDTDGEDRPMRRDDQIDTSQIPEIAGVVFTTIEDERGNKFLQATGQTLQNKEKLQRSGFRWVPEQKAWYRPVA